MCKLYEIFFIIFIYEGSNHMKDYVQIKISYKSQTRNLEKIITSKRMIWCYKSFEKYYDKYYKNEK